MKKETSQNRSLFICITPLQLLIAENLTSLVPGSHYILYMPYSNSDAHRHYFNKLRFKHKYFVDYAQQSSSHTLSELVTWSHIPEQVKHQKYNDLFFSSIGLFSIAHLVKKNPKANIHMFDDGTFNLNKRLFSRWIFCESLVRKLIKKMSRLPLNPCIMDRVSTHYTIYPPALNTTWCNNIMQIQLIDSFSRYLEDLSLAADPSQALSMSIPSRSLPSQKYTSNTKKVSSSTDIVSYKKFNQELIVVLDSWSPNRNLNELRRHILSRLKIDIYVPHPQSSTGGRALLISEFARRCLTNIKIDHLIAEDIVVTCARLGYKIKLYGFNSSALYNLSGIANSINILLDNEPPVSPILSGFLGIDTLHYTTILKENINETNV